ncbi:hypothetical protein [Thiorhodococcus fuscus]|uniref:Uncharacterized protein n=1 Tax=Thiorhodococcus fuscus TaxID=527200 RepID=A0ABW4Y8K4_9GAMM
MTLFGLRQLHILVDLGEREGDVEIAAPEPQVSFLIEDLVSSQPVRSQAVELDLAALLADQHVVPQSDDNAVTAMPH